MILYGQILYSLRMIRAFTLILFSSHIMLVKTILLYGADHKNYLEIKSNLCVKLVKFSKVQLGTVGC